MKIVKNEIVVGEPRRIGARAPAALVIAASLLSLCATIATDHGSSDNRGAEPHRFGHLARGL